MNKVFRSIVVVPGLALIMTAALLAPAGAQTKVSVKHCTMTGMSSMHPVAAVPASIAAIKLPCTFTCKHCGIKMTIKTPADWLKPCPACPCGTAAWQCYPTKGK